MRAIQATRRSCLRAVVRASSRAGIAGAGALLGLLGGAAYGHESAAHMVVAGPHDVLAVGTLLAVLAAATGWLAGLMLDQTAVGSRLRQAAKSKGRTSARTYAEGTAGDSGERQSQT